MEERGSNESTENIKMNQTMTSLQNTLEKKVLQQQKLLADYTTALKSGDFTKQLAIQKQMTQLMAEMQRLSDEQRYAQAAAGRVLPDKPKSKAPGKTMREQVLDALDEMGVALSPSTISEYIQTMTGVAIPASRFASLRRDEERSAKRDISSRPAWIVPAISTAYLNAIPRLLTSSAWSLERRLIGARSLRVNHLHITLAFLQRFERLAAVNAPQAQAIEALVLRYARGIPGAVTSGSAINPEVIREIALSELAAIKEADQGEREEAANKLSRFTDQQKLWGLPSVIQGGSREGRAG
jgi:hypothetical protein